MENRPRTTGLRHLALTVQNLEQCLHFYQDLVGMHIEWQPDADNIYLTSGMDNLALHRAPKGFLKSEHQSLDHLGFIINSKQEVQDWYDFLNTHGADLKTEVKHHRDGAVSFYCRDPDGNGVQFIYHPPLVVT